MYLLFLSPTKTYISSRQGLTLFCFLYLQQLPKCLKHGINIYWLHKHLNHLSINYTRYLPLISFLAPSYVLLATLLVTWKLYFSMYISVKHDLYYGAWHIINMHKCLLNLNIKFKILLSACFLFHLGYGYSRCWKWSRKKVSEGKLASFTIMHLEAVCSHLLTEK